MPPEISSTPMKHATTYIDADKCVALENGAKTLRNRLIIQLLWRCGMRCSEVINLKRKDIIIEGDNLEIKLLTMSRPEDSVLIVWSKGKPKNRVRQRVHINVSILDDLKRYIAKFQPDQFIFPSWSKSGHISRVWVQKIVEKAGDRSGVVFDKGGRKVHPHTLRHSLAIFLVKRGVKLSKIQQILRHKSIASTSYYLTFSQKEIAEDYHRAFEGV